MRASRAACLTCLTLGLLASCTERNPDYDPSTGPCEPGVRSCSGDKLMVCVNATPEPVLQVEQVCAAPSICKEGQCVPNSVACPPPCTGNMVCEVFAVQGKLATYCAPPVGNVEPGSPCQKNEQCQSGLCVSGGKIRVCFRPCATRSRECAASFLHCFDAQVTVGGVSGTVPACVP